jgi:hypothetical protein
MASEELAHIASDATSPVDDCAEHIEQESLYFRTVRHVVGLINQCDNVSLPAIPPTSGRLQHGLHQKKRLDFCCTVPTEG